MLVQVYSYYTTENLSASKNPIKSLPELYRKYLEVQFRKNGDQEVQHLKLLHYKEAFIKFFSGNVHAEKIVEGLNKHIKPHILSDCSCKAEIEHKTFSEFLLAEFVVENWKNSNIIDSTTLFEFVYKTLLATYQKAENRKNSEVSRDLEYDTLESVLLKMGTGNLHDISITNLIYQGWSETLEKLQASVLRGQLTFRHSAICYFLNDILSNEESTLGSLSQEKLVFGLNSLEQSTMISKDFISKILVSLSFRYRHLFQLVAKLFRETTNYINYYANSEIFQTILVLAVRTNDVEIFSYFRLLLETSSGASITSIRFHINSLKNIAYEHTPLHETAKCGNLYLFELLFEVYHDNLHKMPGLVLVTLADSSKDSDDIIKNKIKIIRKMSSKNLIPNFKNIKRSSLDGIHVTLFTKVCDLVRYALTEKDVKWLYKFVVCNFTKVRHMDIFVNWIISKDLTQLLLYSYEPGNHLVMDALRQNVLGSQSLENIFNSQSFDLGSIIYFVLKCKNRHELVKTMIGLISDINLDDTSDPTILHWATCMFESDPMNYVSFDMSSRANINQRMTSHKLAQVKLHCDKIRRIIRENQSLTDSGQIKYNPNEILGVGRFCIVYSGTLNGRRVAVKKIYYTPEQEERVAQETKLHLECDGHENIIKCFYVQKSTQTFLIALEVCGFDLKHWVQTKHLFDTKLQTRDILCQITRGLDYLHSKGVVHLDLTPQNILLTPMSNQMIKIKISDFGMSRKLPIDKNSIKLDDGIEGIKWMAPEVLSMTSELSTSADIFSLGCVFYYVLSNGDHPFGVQLADIKENILHDSLSVITGHLKEPLFVHLFYLMTNKQPDIRPTAAALLKHHIFWSEKTMLGFLVAISNAADQPKATSKISILVEKVEKYPLLQPYYEPLDSKGWIRFLCQDVQKYVCGIGCKRKPYAGDLFFDLIRAIRNMQAHKQELPEKVQAAVGRVPDFFMRYWLKRFAIIFEIIWRHFEVLKNDSSTALSEYYSDEYNFNHDTTSERADKILEKYIKKQCYEMILHGPSI